MKTLGRVFIVLALLSLGIPIVAAPASAACGWKIVTSDNLGNSGNPNRLLAVAARTATDAWAVGYAYRFGLNKMLVEHWNGTSWTADLAPSVSGMNNQLDGVAILSAKNVWAVGWAGTSPTTPEVAVIEHYNGRSWKRFTTHAPVGKSELLGIAAISAKNIWAVGFNTTAPAMSTSLILHWNGTSWLPVTGPDPVTSTQNHLLAITRVPGTSELWAVGQQWTGSAWETEAFHYVSATWSDVTSADQGTFPKLQAAAAVSASNVWAFGGDTNVASQETLAEQWTGSAWATQTSPNPVSGSYSWYGAAAKGSTLWIVGTSRSSTGNDKTLTVRRTSGGFTVVASPTPAHRQGSFFAVASIPGTHRLWAVGSQFSNSTVDRTLVERYC